MRVLKTWRGCAAGCAVMLVMTACGRNSGADARLAVHRDVASMLAESLARVEGAERRLAAAQSFLASMTELPSDADGNILKVRLDSDRRLEVFSAGPDGRDGTEDDIAVKLPSVGEPR